MPETTYSRLRFKFMGDAKQPKDAVLGGALSFLGAIPNGETVSAPRERLFPAPKTFAETGELQPETKKLYEDTKARPLIPIFEDIDSKPYPAETMYLDLMKQTEGLEDQELLKRFNAPPEKQGIAGAYYHPLDQPYEEFPIEREDRLAIEKGTEDVLQGLRTGYEATAGRVIRPIKKLAEKFPEVIRRANLPMEVSMQQARDRKVQGKKDPLEGMWREIGEQVVPEAYGKGQPGISHWLPKDYKDRIKEIEPKEWVEIVHEISPESNWVTVGLMATALDLGVDPLMWLPLSKAGKISQEAMGVLKTYGDDVTARVLKYASETKTAITEKTLPGLIEKAKQLEKTIVAPIVEQGKELGSAIKQSYKEEGLFRTFKEGITPAPPVGKAGQAALPRKGLLQMIKESGGITPESAPRELGIRADELNRMYPGIISKEGKSADYLIRDLENQGWNFKAQDEYEKIQELSNLLQEGKVKQTVDFEMLSDLEVPKYMDLKKQLKREPTAKELKDYINPPKEKPVIPLSEINKNDVYIIDGYGQPIKKLNETQKYLYDSYIKAGKTGGIQKQGRTSKYFKESLPKNVGFGDIRKGKDLLNVTAEEFPDALSKQVKTTPAEALVEELNVEGAGGKIRALGLTEEEINAQMIQARKRQPSLKGAEQIEEYSQTPSSRFMPETKPGEKQRGFIKTVGKSSETSPELQAKAGTLEQKYKPVTDIDALNKADEIISASPDKAKEMVLDMSTPLDKIKVTTAIRLMKKYDLERNFDASLEIMAKMDIQLRRAGQGEQAVTLWNKLSPEGFLRGADKTAIKVGRPLSDDVRKEILKRANEVYAMPEGAKKIEAMAELLNYTADKMPPKFGEMFEAYRYQNMLSGPMTQLRNIESNTLNVLMTRPLDLTAEATWSLFKHPFNPLARDVKFMDVPRYYKQVVTSIPNSIVAFKETFKTFGGAAKYDMLLSEGTINALRKAKLPKSLTVVPRFMESTDKFFSTLIMSGEKARLMRNGVKEADALVQARTLAEKYLYRERIGTSAKDMPYLVRALDSVGTLALSMRKIPMIGKPYSWFVPFITTPVNVAKLGVEHSILGLAGGSYKTAQISKAMVGTTVMGYGGLLALQGRTSWEAPTNPKAKKEFYDSGRKEYSVNIGGVWIPMAYFGPLALSLAIPSAVKYYSDESNKALTDDQLTKTSKMVMSVGRYITSQTPLQGVSGFYKILDGDEDYSAPGALAFTAGQVIPAEGLIRYITTWVDPIFRKPKGFIQSLEKDIPGLSKTLPPITDSKGKPAEREFFNYFLPWGVGKQKIRHERNYKEFIKEGQEKAVKNKEKAENPKLKPYKRPGGRGRSIYQSIREKITEKR